MFWESRTWNTWFDQGGDCEARWSGLYDIALSEEEGERLDVVALQEVIARSFKLLLEREDVRRDWLVVDCAFSNFGARRRLMPRACSRGRLAADPVLVRNYHPR